jgi:serine/threonine-protein kinase
VIEAILALTVDFSRQASIDDSAAAAGTGIQLQPTGPWLHQGGSNSDDIHPAPGAKPQSIPGYEVLEELGRGGMGVVYKARHIRLQRLVAIKMILAGAHAGPQELARFRHEAEAVAHLQHANIVQIYEIGEHEGNPYFALEFVEGGSLAKGLDGTPRPARLAAHFVEKLARAINAAHERGIIHRDLKPANILLAGDGQPKIADFGLAKRLDAGPGLTERGVIVGTPSYMAPEQAGYPAGRRAQDQANRSGLRHLCFRRDSLRTDHRPAAV